MSNLIAAKDKGVDYATAVVAVVVVVVGTNTMMHGEHIHCQEHLPCNCGKSNAADDDVGKKRAFRMDVGV